jgi:hypothetical protein
VGSALSVVNHKKCEPGVRKLNYRIRIFFDAIFWVAGPVLPVPVYYNLGQAFLFQQNDSRGQKDHQFIFVIGFLLIFKQPAQEAQLA